MTDRDWLLLSPFDRVRVADILQAVSEQTGYSAEFLAGPRRNRPLVRARQLIMHIAMEHCAHLTCRGIGRQLGDKDHTTIMHGHKRAEALLATSGEYRELRGKVLRRLGLVPATVELRIVK